MTIHATIIDVNCAPSGWVEVDPIDYEYTGPDPDGEVIAYLERLKNGTREFHWPEDFDHDGREYPPEFKMVTIMKTMQSFDEVWHLTTKDDLDYDGG